jgi:hypothetical protein
MLQVNWPILHDVGLAPPLAILEPTPLIMSLNPTHICNIHEKTKNDIDISELSLVQETKYCITQEIQKNTESITQSVDIADQHEQEAHMELEQSEPIVYQVKLYGILHETL